MSMGQSESRSNGKVAKGLHPHSTWNHEDVFFWTLYFLSLRIVSAGEGESRSNGGVAKDFHPHRTWNYEHVIFGFCIFF